jgi:hypothetical protein
MRKLSFKTSAHTSAQSKPGETLGRRATGLKKKDELGAKSLVNLTKSAGPPEDLTSGGFLHEGKY